MMRFVCRDALGFLLVLVVCISIGSCEKTTGPGGSTLPPGGMRHLWSKRFGDGNYQTAQAVAVDASGNVIVTGSFDGTVDFGGGALTSAGNTDIFVAKLGSNGAHVWSKRFGDGSVQGGEAVAVDISGNVVLAGFFEGVVDFGGGALTSAGSSDIFVAKFGSNGACLWSKRFGDGSDQIATAVAIDASGNVIVTGVFYGAVDFGDGALTSAGSSDIFVAKFGSDGACLWSKRFGDESGQTAQAVAVDASGDIFVAGYFEGTVDFGGGALTNAGDMDIFVAKLGPGGAHVWSKRFGDADYQFARAIAVDASGNAIVTGDIDGTVDFGGGALTSAGSADVFVVKVASDGTHVWSKIFGDESYQRANGVAVDAFGNVLVTGSFYGAVDFGGGALTSAGQWDIFVTKFGSDGACLGSRRFGDSNSQFAYAVAADASGNAIITGDFDGTVDLGGGALTSAGGRDIFVAKLGR
ncbi:MAG: hypothetical protein ABR899_00075 [Candidatus Krumholzibacteriaceae bacterium]